MFDLLQRNLVWIPVKWPGLKPSEIEGETAVEVEHSISLQVEILGRTEFAAWIAPPPPAKNAAAQSDRELQQFKTVVQDWRGVVDGAKSLPFADENICRLLQVPNFNTGFGDAYYKAWQGQAETRESNSESLPPVGQAGEAISGTATETTQS